MSLPHSDLSITDYDILAIQQQASALRAKFLHAYAVQLWSRLRHGRAATSRKAPHGAAHA